MDLARLAETTRSTQRIEDQYLALRQGRSDRLDTWLRIRWQRVEALGERRLGRSVEIDDVATRATFVRQRRAKPSVSGSPAKKV